MDDAEDTQDKANGAGAAKAESGVRNRTDTAATAPTTAAKAALSVQNRTPAEPKKRGAPKGRPKPAGSGRRKNSPSSWTTPEARAHLLEVSGALKTAAKYCAGERITVAGPTGKTITRPPSADEQLKALKMVLDRCIPVLSSMELTGRDGERLIPHAEPADADPRDVARAVLSIIHRASAIDGAELQPGDAARVINGEASAAYTKGGGRIRAARWCILPSLYRKNFPENFRKFGRRERRRTPAR